MELQTFFRAALTVTELLEVTTRTGFSGGALDHDGFVPRAIATSILGLVAVARFLPRQPQDWWRRAKIENPMRRRSICTIVLLKVDSKSIATILQARNAFEQTESRCIAF